MTSNDLRAMSASAFDHGREDLARELDKLADEIAGACPRCGCVQYVNNNAGALACAFCGTVAVTL